VARPTPTWGETALCAFLELNPAPRNPDDKEVILFVAGLAWPRFTSPKTLVTVRPAAPSMLPEYPKVHAHMLLEQAGALEREHKPDSTEKLQVKDLRSTCLVER